MPESVPATHPLRDGSGTAAPRRLRLGQWTAISLALLAIVLVAGVVVGGRALARQDDARRLIIEQLDPARAAAQDLSAAVFAQQSAVRGFALNAAVPYLDAYATGQARQRTAVAQLRRLGAATPRLGSDLDGVVARTAAWRREFITPGIARVQRQGPAATPNAQRAARSRASFAQVTGAMDALAGAITSTRASAQHRLDEASRSVRVSFYGIAALLALTILVAALTLRRAIFRPLERLAAQVRDVAHGELGHELHGEGPAEVVALAGDVDSMRRRILSDLEEVTRARVTLERQAQHLEEQAVELGRSNAELEQFAYVASHDLQEPLRKVASFCQLLQRRYEGQLDERADQYIGFAVDGAKRMQALISDLLSFSRVGRAEIRPVPVDLAETMQDALGNLATSIDDAGARIEVGLLPRVQGDPILLTAVLQNLVGNAVKFRGDRPPVVRVASERDGDRWVVSVSDDGIGVDPEFAEQIFAIFQRLHAKERYEGTGIGLALCRKIVEHHGGRIWLDTGVRDGTTFRFTLPAGEAGA